MKILKICRIIDNDQGFVYTLEAILGIFVILGVVMFATGGFPYTTQKTGEHSKVQLVNIGRDALDLIELTPITDIFSNYSRSAGVYRQYYLVANKTFVRPGENINFTVYYMDTNQIVNNTLILEQTVLGLKTALSTKPINGSVVWNFSTIGEYNIRAYEGNPDTPTSWSNYVTIIVGYYHLYTDIDGISENGSKIVDGIVYGTNNSGAPNLIIQILNYDYSVANNSATKTSSERVIENFESTNNWISNGNLGINTTRTQGSYSVWVNGISNYWIKKTNNSYKLLRYDNLSFDFFSNSGAEIISVELSKNNTTNKLVWNNVQIQNFGWNKINLELKNPDSVIGNLLVQDIDTVNISVIGGDNNLFDNLTVSAGSFSFVWPITSTGSYYIQAIDSSGNTSNKHRIIYSKKNGGLGYIYALEYTIYETDSTKIILIPNKDSDNLDPIGGFKINLEKYKAGCYDLNKINMTLDPNDPKKRTVTFTGNIAGDYYIFYGETGGGCGVGPGLDPANGAKTNGIVIHVLPFQSNCLVGDCKPKCSGLDMDDLNVYMRLFIPYYINYNMYLINPDGSLCKDCPEFQEMINGYPTDEAVTVNKIFHIKTINGEYLRELRIISWYK